MADEGHGSIIGLICTLHKRRFDKTIRSDSFTVNHWFGLLNSVLKL